MNDLQSLLTREKLEAFHTGLMKDAYLYFGAHVAAEETRFTIWVPDAASVAVACTDPASQREEIFGMQQHPFDSTIWQLQIPQRLTGYAYEYIIETPNGELLRKSDPYAQASEMRPRTKSVVAAASKHTWSKTVLHQKKIQNKNHFEKPMAIYEVHIGTWKRNAQGGFLNYRELASELIPYILDMGFTHIEILPITEHPLDESWGYQTTGYFAPTSRYGTADDLKYFIAKCAEHKVGLILDWIPGHFCVDEHAMVMFNGTPLYEDEREERRANPDWGTLNFDIQKGEVVSFLISSAHYWLNEFKFDAFRMDALVCLLFIPNRKERPHNKEGADFLRKLTNSLKEFYPETLLIAEDAWHYPKVTHEVSDGGVGFHYKWNFGWMRDTLDYMETPPSQRSEVHQKMNFSLVYQYQERYLLALSHDEVVNGRGSLLNKLPGTLDERFLQLRLLLGFWIAHPGKKLLFMGQEFGHFEEWEFKPELDWPSLEDEDHRKMADFTKELLSFYKAEKAFFELDDHPDGFTWIDADNHEQSVAAFVRRGYMPQDECIVVCNFSNHHYTDFKLGVPKGTAYEKIFTTGKQYRKAVIEAADAPYDDLPYSVVMDLPAFTMNIWKQKQDGSGAG
ncbi:1,4-alpha-glucan branching protein GlgB [Planococcus sp. CPCC 101016]|uniref:1,4-alpha-glucan branching protein GlgB n=1 Tax=Planococcus sp. CPCC 101016 TaxID=2599617 RepID=UPI0011B61FC1|nr:1,4-alpha-glucan branching protein GlgB [Planococcus sp. CPCC 101016]TWT04339.1 1,4-alpha-glucan branching protein GlgB [Planococcus sp. CPCC 101016]